MKFISPAAIGDIEGVKFREASAKSAALSRYQGKKERRGRLLLSPFPIEANNISIHFFQKREWP